MRKEVNPMENAGKCNNFFFSYFLFLIAVCYIIASYWWLCFEEG